MRAAKRQARHQAATAGSQRALQDLNGALRLTRSNKRIRFGNRVRLAGHGQQQKERKPRINSRDQTQGISGMREIATAGPADQLSESGTPRFWISSIV
jgi:hypothetical protein